MSQRMDRLLTYMVVAVTIGCGVAVVVLEVVK
jgi:hypothetical protein